eukprot:CAMPEP_0198703372 /NCGR_PEP_ID=MMETSP1468-20131203/389308_1 /TAXON_ID=1461545 /ORGANISM="Mantoniella sp, Strain CCMP1436" /LENGTH=37 /DNA_ID= /DNA_START= /DNA_END= /DNA_ORIENTATION=
MTEVKRVVNGQSDGHDEVDDADDVESDVANYQASKQE